MSHIAFFNIPAVGHVYPTLALVGELVRRGHRVTYASVASRAAAIEAVGATVVPYRSTRPSDTDPGVRPPDRAGYLNDSMSGFVEEAETTLAQLEAAYRDDEPDLVVYDRMSFAGRVFAEKRAIPAIQSWAVLISNEHWSLFQLAPPVDPADPGLLAWVERLGSFLSRHGLSLSPEEFLAPKPERHLAFFPRAFQYRGELFDDSYCFVGPCIRPTAAAARWHPPDGDPPVLLVTLGTIYNRHPDFYRTCVAAFAGSPWHVVIAVGERMDPADLGPLPDNIEVHRVVPQLDVLAHTAVLICQAGMGGIMEAVTFGVPVVAVPQTLEQEANAARVVELGIGVQVASAGLTPAALRAAVDLLAKDPVVPQRIGDLRREIAACGGTSRAADIVAACLPGPGPAPPAGESAARPPDEGAAGESAAGPR